MTPSDLLSMARRSGHWAAMLYTWDVEEGRKKWNELAREWSDRSCGYWSRWRAVMNGGVR